MSRILSFAFGFGILGAAITTWIAPRVISLLFTPPVSFGTNCEPAAMWASDKLVSSQLVGLFSGFLVGAGLVAYRKFRHPADSTNQGTPRVVTP